MTTVETPAPTAGLRTSGTPPLPVLASHGHVVVGLRQSRLAAGALAVGFAEASRRTARLTVMVIRDAETNVDTAAADADRLEQAIAAAAARFSAVSVSIEVRTGHFVEVLVELSRTVDLLVLGLCDRSTGMGRKDLLIASRSQCPVVVVREP